jgi:integrase
MSDYFHSQNESVFAIEANTALLHSNTSASNRQQVLTKGTCMTKTRTTKKAKYRVDVRLPDGRRLTRTFERKYDADKFKTEMKIEKIRFETSGFTINNLITFKELSDDWYQNEVKNRKSLQTQRNYFTDLKNYINPIVGHIKLRDINIRHARAIENNMLELGKHPRTINKVMMVFKTVLNDAVRSNHLLKNPIRGYPELKEPPRDLTYWSKEEIKIFLDFVKDNPLYELYVVTLNTGMRLGEVLGLMWDKVDFVNSQIIVSRSLGRSGLKNTTKSNKARFIPMNANVRASLEKLHKRRLNDSFVFTDEEGRHLDYNHVTERHFMVAQREAGLTKIIRFHDLRHTFASHFMMNGGNLYTLQKLLGHSDIQTTMIYAHLDADFLRQSIELIRFE